MSVPGARDRLTIVVAAYNEADALPMLHARLLPVLSAMDDVDARILYVDDGSRDATWAAMQRLAASDARVDLLRLSRNFGKEVALTAGLDRIDEGAAMILDADAQDPPELIPQFVAKWRAGFDNVYGRRSARAGEGIAKRATASMFYRLIGRLSDTPVPEDTGDFRLLSPRALAALRELRERHRFMKGLFGWVGFNSAEIAYEREARIAGRSKFNFWKLWNLALEGITSFSTAPLRISTYLGLFTACIALAYGIYVIAKAWMYGDPVAGWPSMMAVILFLGGVQLIALGMIGEYLGRLYVEAKQRPLYVVADWRPGTGRRMLAMSPERGAAMRQVRHLLESKQLGVVSIAPDSPVIDALRLMADQGVGAILVMEEGRKLVGILSERDYARKVVLLGRTSANTPVSEIMSHQVVCGRLADSVDHCMQVMTDKRIRHLPIVEHKEVVGIVSIGDLVKAVIDQQQIELQHLQRYIAS